MKGVDVFYERGGSASRVSGSASGSAHRALRAPIQLFTPIPLSPSYRGTSLIRNCLGPFAMVVRGVLKFLMRGFDVSYVRGGSA